MIRPRPTCGLWLGQDPSQPWAGKGGECKSLNLNLGDGGRGGPRASHVHQLSSAPATPSPGPSASHTALTWKPEAEVGGRPGTRSEDEWLPPQPPGETGKRDAQVLPLQAGLLASLGMEVDTGACESSPADGLCLAR